MSKMVTVYGPNGEVAEVTHLNAMDMTRLNGWTWKPTMVMAEPDAAPEPEVAPIEETVAEPEAEDEDARAAPTLEGLAESVIGEPDVVRYLQGFGVEQLRSMAAEAYGKTFHPRTGKATMIERIIGFEDERLHG